MDIYKTKETNILIGAMAKHRTRKQKEFAKHNFRIHWETPSTDSKFEADVKREFENEAKSVQKKAVVSKRAELTAEDVDLTIVRKDIIRSLILASFILASEIVIYLVWY